MISIQYDPTTHVLVPIEPTEEMLSAMSNFVMGEHRYVAMIEAAPQAPAAYAPVRLPDEPPVVWTDADENRLDTALHHAFGTQAPAAQLCVGSTCTNLQCNYPLCKSEAEQDAIGKQVYAQLYSGEEAPAAQPATDASDFADLVPQTATVLAGDPRKVCMTYSELREFAGNVTRQAAQPVSMTDEQIINTLQEIDNIARDYDGYEYGLPFHVDSVLSEMVASVRALFGQEAK